MRFQNNDNRPDVLYGKQLASREANRTGAFNTNQFSFEEQNQQQYLDAFTNSKEPPFHLHENSLMDKRNAAEMAIEIIVAKHMFVNKIY